MTFFCLAALVGCGAEAPASSVQVEVVDVAYQQRPGGARILTGRLCNRGREALANAQLQVSLFDADNQRIDAMIILVQNIGVGACASFREPIDDDLDVRGVRVRSVLVL